MQHPLKLVLLIVFMLTLAIPTLAQDDPTTFIEENPDSVSVVCVQGDEVLVEHLADEPLTLASTSKMIILAEYARQVAFGNLDPDAEIALDDVELYHIAGTDGGAHEQWLSTLDPDAETVTMSQIVDGMMIFSTNSGADYVLAQLDDAGFTELYDLLDMQNTDLPSSFLGNLLVLSNHELGITDLEYVESLDQETFLAEEARLLDLFLTDADWREAELEFRDSLQVGLPEIDVQSAFFDQFTTQSTANDLLKLVQAPYTDSGLSEDAQIVMQGHLDWIFDVNPANEDVYEVLATKGGAYASVLTSVWYVEAIGSEPVSLVVLYHDLPSNEWQQWLTTGDHQALELQVVATPAGCPVFADILPEG
ncbi:MAG: serine hydrolase [Chloroflexota bacterium]